MGSATVAELKRRTSMVQEELVEKEQDSMVEVLALLGAHLKSSRRETTQAVRRLVTEIYSPPRVTEMLKHMSNHKLTPGLAIDLTTVDPDDGTPWDLSLGEARIKVLNEI